MLLGVFFMYWQSILLLHTFVFVVKTIIGAILRRSLDKALQLVLIQIYGADVSIQILVIIVKDTGFAVRRLLAYGLFHGAYLLCFDLCILSIL